MTSNEAITLRRDCEAVLIPAGNKVTLKQGEQVYITQALGGSYTAIINGNMVRIDGKNADAIGKEAAAAKQETKPVAEGPLDDKQLEEEIWNRMRTCYDPEIPVNIVDLGLIYDMKLTALPEGGRRVDVKMTLTAPGCGMGDVLRQDVESKIMSIEGIKEAHAELVWEPQWNQGMMSEAARLQLGLM